MYNSKIYSVISSRARNLLFILLLMSINSFAQVKISNLPAITTIDSADVIPIVDGSADTTKKMTMYQLAQEVMTGGVSYSFTHGFAYKDSTVYTPNTPARYQYVRIVPSTTVGEADGVTIAGDSITIVTAGDYLIRIACSVEGGANEDYHLKMFINSAPAATPQGSYFITTTGANNYQTVNWFWYRSLNAGDDLSFWIANNTNANDPSFRSFKFYIERKPE